MFKQFCPTDALLFSPYNQAETRAEVSATALLSLDRFDDIYNNRRREKDARAAAIPKKPDLLFEKPDLKTFLQILRKMLSSPETVVPSAEKLLELGRYLSDDPETFARNHVFFVEIVQVVAMFYLPEIFFYQNVVEKNFSPILGSRPIFFHNRAFSQWTISVFVKPALSNIHQEHDHVRIFYRSDLFPFPHSGKQGDPSP